MHSQTQRVRFVTWTFIILFVTAGTGLYFWSQKKYGTRAGVVTSSPAIADTTLTTGLVGYWTFDRAHVTWADTTTEIKDTAGTNHGNALGSLAAGSLALGKQGQALTFNGTSDYISAPNSTTFTDLSVSAWVYPTMTLGADQSRYILSKGAVFDFGYYCNSVTCVYQVGLNGFVEMSTSPLGTTLNTWHHIVLTFNDAANRYEVYEDGAIKILNDNTYASSLNANSNPIGIGRSETGATNYFIGKIDDARVYNRTLSASEVYQLYTMGGDKVNAPLEDPLSQGLLGYWKMDEGTGTSTTADSSGNATTLTMTAIDSGDWQTGQIGPFMLDLDGAANPNSEYLTVADPASGILDFADGASFSITGWFNRDTFTTDDTLVAKRVGVASGNTGYAVWIDSGTDVLNFEVTDGVDEYSRASTTASAFTATGWHQFAAVFNDTIGMNIYIDGAENQQTASGTIGNIGSLANAEAFRIGVLSDASTTSPFDGKLDDIRVYGSALSADQVLKLYQTTAPAQPVDTSLVGHWTFDGPDIQGTTAIDRSGKGNNGTRTGTTPIKGKLGQGLSFNGTSDYVSALALNVTSFSVSLWFKPLVASGSSDISSLVKNKDRQFEIRWDSTASNEETFGITSGGGTYYGVDIGTVTTNAWSHIVGTWDGTTMRAYNNGALSGSLNPGVLPDTGGANIFEIGRNDNWAGYANVVLDDVRVYNRALSATEVSQLYTSGNATVNAPVEDPLSQSLQGYWKLDDNTGTNATDASGNANTLAMTGSPTWTAPGQIGTSMLDFSGTAQYLSIADPASGVLDFADGTSFSLTGWFNRDTFANDHTIIAKKNDQTTNQGYVLWVDNNGTTDTLIFEASDGTDTYQLPSVTQVNATGWHQFAVSWNDAATTNPVNMYIDGALSNGTATGTFANVNSLANALAFRIGAESDAGVPFDGKIDDIRVYGSALSADQVAKLYQTTAPAQPVDTSLVGHWTFNGPDIQGTTAIDRSGKGNNGTRTGTTPAKGKLGQGLSFNGTSDYVDAGNPTTLQLTGSMTVSAWVKANAFVLATDHPIVGKYETSGNQKSYSLFATVDNTPRQFGFDVSSNGADDIVRYTNTTVAVGVWYHVVGVYDSSGQTLNVYLNGSLDNGILSAAVPSSIFNGTASLLIGARTSYYWNGSIDDVRIYNRALSATEIANLYNIGK